MAGLPAAQASRMAESRRPLLLDARDAGDVGKADGDPGRIAAARLDEAHSVQAGSGEGMAAAPSAARPVEKLQVLPRTNHQARLWRWRSMPAPTFRARSRSRSSPTRRRWWCRVRAG